MIFLYIYASLAAAGILALPSYGAWFNANHAFKYGSYGGGPVVKLGDEMKMYPYNSILYNNNDPMDWWKVNSTGSDRFGLFDEIRYPASLAIRILAWPITIAYYLLGHIYLASSKVLAIPGQKFVQRELNKKEENKYLTEGKKEVEKLLRSV